MTDKKAQDQFYILANASIADTQVHVLKHGELFSIFDRHGDIRPLGFENHGLFFEGTRYVSRLHLKINGQSPLLLSSAVRGENDILGVDLTNPDFEDPASGFVPRGTIHVAKSICLWDGRYFEKMTVSNFGIKPVSFTLSLEFEADFADIFEVRGMKRLRRGEKIPAELDAQGITLGYCGLDGFARRTRFQFQQPPAHLQDGLAEFPLTLKPHETYYAETIIACLMENEVLAPISCDGAFFTSRQHFEDAEALSCGFESNNDPFNDWVMQSRADLHILLTKTPQGLYPFAGIPWFSTYFGRDGIITAFETLWFYPEIAQGVLNYLAVTQAQDKIESQDADPGKILHEQRKGEMAALGEIPFGLYYGSIDSTPLFVMLAGAYWERTGDLALIRKLWPPIERALEWIDRYGDRDGDGFVEYCRLSSNGLANQGWKDSDDSVFHADGRLAEAPIALCEVQGYVYAAKNYAAQMARALGNGAKAATLHEEAESFKKKFQKAFWCEEIGMYALALDGKKQPCKVMSSNAGHCLFTRIAAEDHAYQIMKNFMSDRFFSGWGVRTIAMGEARYNPMSYHNGSVWPHDNALIAYGLSLYGYKEAALKIFSGLYNATPFFKNHRPPELFCGFTRREGEGPTLYPVACDPQAWASAAVFLLLQASLGLCIHADGKKVVFNNPALPAFLSWLNLNNLKINSASTDLNFERHSRDVGVNVLRKEGQVEVIAAK